MAEGEAGAAVRVTEHMNDAARAAGLDTLVIDSITAQTDAGLAASWLGQASERVACSWSNARAVTTASAESEAGWPLACELMARLVEAEEVAAHALLRDVWVAASTIGCATATLYM